MPDLLTSGIDHSVPLSFTQVTTGEVFIANGVMKPRRWNNTDITVENAGIPQADDTMSVAASGSGSLTGVYKCAVRYMDDEDTPGDLSLATSVTASSHQYIDYSSIPVPTESRVSYKQIWRTTAGETTTFYLDKDNLSLSSTTYQSSLTDTQLAAKDSLPVLNADGTLNARRFGVPPDWKAVVVAHQGRTFWGVNAIIDDGHISLTSGSVTATVYGANLSSVIVGRQLYIPRHETLYTISAYSASNNQLTLSSAYGGSSSAFSRYEIQVDQSERNRVYFSEADEPESVPSTNAIDMVTTEGDAGPLTAIMSMGAFVWLMTPNRTYRWTYQAHPVLDGNIYFTTSRGCLNQNCWTLAEGRAFIMDRQGCYVFNGGTTDPISRSIQDYFRPGGGIVWDNSKWFHVSHDLSNSVVKFFVCLDGSQYPRHALCFYYRSNQWDVEEYPWQIPCSTTGLLSPHDRLFVGTTHNRIMVSSEGYRDGPVMALDGRQSPTAVSRFTITISGIFTATDLTYVPVTIVSGRGTGQTRNIVHATTGGVLTINEPWHIQPDTESVIQIGGIEWKMKTRWFRWLDTEKETNRSVQLIFKPLTEDSSLDLAVYKNHSVTAASFVISYDRMDGLKTNDALDGITVDLQENVEGWVYWALDDQQDFRGPACRFVQLGLSGVQNNQQVIIYGIDFNGIRK